MGRFSSPEAHLRPRKCRTGSKEALMHIHSNETSFNVVNPWSAAAERAAATQKAADIRKRLMGSASEIQGVSSPDEAAMVGKWMVPGQSPLHVDVEYHTSTAGKDSDFG